VELAIITVALLVLGSLVPKGHTWPQEIALLKWGQRLDLPYSKDDLRVIYRIPAAWRVERVCPDRDTLTQHFELLKGAAPHYQARKML
jgi:hypothetical protein